MSLEKTIKGSAVTLLPREPGFGSEPGSYHVTRASRKLSLRGALASISVTAGYALWVCDAAGRHCCSKLLQDFAGRGDLGQQTRTAVASGRRSRSAEA